MAGRDVGDDPDHRRTPRHESDHLSRRQSVRLCDRILAVGCGSGARRVGTSAAAVVNDHFIYLDVDHDHDHGRTDLYDNGPADHHRATIHHDTPGHVHHLGDELDCGVAGDVGSVLEVSERAHHDTVAGRRGGIVIGSSSGPPGDGRCHGRNGRRVARLAVSSHAQLKRRMEMEVTEIVVLAARVWAGVVMLAHGVNHARTQEGTANWFRKVGFKAPEMNAKMAAASEVAIGLGLIAGVLTSFAAAGLVATMLGAFWSVHRFSGFFVFRRPDEGYEYVATLAILALVVATVGPGPVSGDAVLGIDETFNGATGALIVGLGLLVGALQLAALWRRPTRAEDQ